MKIFFNSSIRGKKYFSKNYELIYEMLKDTDNEVTTAVFDSTPKSIAKETLEETEKFFTKLEKTVKKSDAGVFEVSYPSLGIGYEIARFIEQSKPVIVLHVPNKRQYVLESMRNDKLCVFEYDMNSLNKIFDEIMTFLKSNLDSRFTMLMPPSLNVYLSEVSQKYSTSRSEYIRNLIIEDKKQNS